RTSIAKRYKAMTSHLLRCVRLPRDRRYGWHLTRAVPSRESLLAFDRERASRSGNKTMTCLLAKLFSGHSRGRAESSGAPSGESLFASTANEHRRTARGDDEAFMRGFWRGCPVDTMNRMRFMPTWSRCGHNDSQDAGRHGTFAAMSPPGPAPTIQLRGVYKRFVTPTGEAYTALRDLNLQVQPGEFCAVVGPTGCGKSTTLALISGLEPPSAGDVLLDGKHISDFDLCSGYVFQSDAVFPWKTGLDTVAAG